MPELVAPAGNFERLKAAFNFGADAAYIGAVSMSLRNFADNFTDEELKEATALARKMGKRVYVACNAFARDRDIDALPRLLRDIQEAKPDALIVNDPGVIRMAKRIMPDMPLHLSTQANTLNAEAALFWHDAGIKRIILARELTLDEIKSMRDKLPEKLELEMFVHGAMCISYSGRCLLSNYLDGRDSNRGECVQPCRWTYELRERGRDGAYFSIEQDERGTFVLNARDLNLIEYLPKLADAGIGSFKIEGRMKSIAYVATVVNAYRMALDFFTKQGWEKKLPQAIADEVYKASHRPFTMGFTFGDPRKEGQETRHADYVTGAAICAVVEGYDPVTKTAHVFQRNRFFVGDTLEILSPGDIGRGFIVSSIRDSEGNAVSSAPHPKEELYIACNEPIKQGDILRRAQKTAAPEA